MANQDYVPSKLNKQNQCIHVVYFTTFFQIQNQNQNNNKKKNKLVLYPSQDLMNHFNTLGFSLVAWNQGKCLKLKLNILELISSYFLKHKLNIIFYLKIIFNISISK